MVSLWHKTAKLPRFPTLTRDASTEVLVIGGGLSGVLTAYELNRRGVNCMLIEANRIGSGTTGGTTAVLSAQHDVLYADLIRSFGKEKARMYLYANLHAVDRFRDLSGRISCDFADAPSCQYTQSNPAQLRLEVQAVQSLGFPAYFSTDTELPFPVTGATYFPGMAQFHPLKFLSGIAKDLPIYENTQALRITPGLVHTNRGDIRAKKVIVATHFPILNRHGMYFTRLYQMRSFVLALENAPLLNSTYVDTAQGGMYFRSWGDYLIVGGGDHRTGKKGGGFESVEAFVRRTYPSARIRYQWAAQDCMSLDGIPYIGQYSPANPDLYVSTGFNEWGMTSSMIAAELLADAITGRENPYAAVFSPRRSGLHAQLFANLGESILGLIYPTARRCPHMGCALRWNAQEHTWDCPCHGSRFAPDGSILNNPAQKGR